MLYNKRRRSPSTTQQVAVAAQPQTVLTYRPSLVPRDARNVPQYRDAKTYLKFDGASDSLAVMFFTQFLYNALLLNSFIPISLYVSMNFVRFLQAWFMNEVCVLVAAAAFQGAC